MKVKITDYNPEWPKRFNIIKRELLETSGNKIVYAEHIGSTSVPGLGGKPVIDVLLGFNKLSDADLIIPELVKLGYVYRKEFEKTLPNRKYFSKTISGVRVCNVHSYEIDFEERTRHLLFRDYLRHNQKAREEYEKHKRQLARKEWKDADEYAAAKTPFIRNIEKAALDEFTFRTEKTECEATFQMYDRVSIMEKKSCGITAKRFGTATAIRTDIFPGFSHNRVPGLGLKAGLTEKTLIEIKDFFKGSKNIYALQLVPHILNNEAKELLERHGFVFKKNWVRFYRDISPIENVKSGLKVKEIGKEHADTYGEILTRIFGFPRELACTMTSVINGHNWKHYMAFDGEKPVTTGSVYFNGDTAWIGFAATEPTHRGRGGQAAVLAARINAAREHGCKWISVETAEETAEHDAPSYRNMLRYGFRLLYKRPNYVFDPLLPSP